MAERKRKVWCKKKTSKAVATPLRKPDVPVQSSTRKLEDYIPAMLAKEIDQPFSSPEWLFEIKWDGYRAIAELGDELKLYSRNGNSFLNTYPLVVEELKKWDVDAVIDGEIVVLNELGNPEFQKLQHYEQNTNFPIQYYVFDLLRLNGKELYDLPLVQRKELLRDIFVESEAVKYSDHLMEDGVSFFEVAKARDLEGVMAKQADSKYYPGKRTNEWLKVKHHKSEEAVICGFTAPRGGRKYFGALVLGMMVNGNLEYIGHTGSGFDQKSLREMWDRLQPLIREASPFDKRVKTNMPVTWVEPVLVAEMKFSEITSDGKMRHPIFLRLREDKTVKNRTMTEKNASGKKAKAATPKVARDRADKPIPTKEKKALDEKVNDKEIVIGKTKLKTTNRQKIFFPDDSITKGDVIDYYLEMGQYILPYLKDRPESLLRTPNGINAKGFFHKDAGNEAPDFVKRVGLFSDSANKTIEYILCNNQASLVYLNNLGCIEINPWHSTVTALDNPDYMIIDIDPSDNNTFEHVIEAALCVKEILDKAGAYNVCKTSGASGLHIYVPMGKKYTYDQVKDFAYLICMLASEQLPAITTLERSLSKRSKDKIYMDYLQNRRGQTIACVYSLRPKKGATVSTPLLWEEVKSGLTPLDFNIHTIQDRIKSKGDLFTGVFKNAVDLITCIEKLEQ